MHYSENINIMSLDNHIITGKLNLPDTKDEPNVKKLVIFVNNSGPHTYDDHRKWGDMEFNYFDIFAEELAKRNIAFFSYNTRGVRLGKIPPLFAEIEEEEYQKYLPNNSVMDIECIIRYFRETERFKNVKILLLGWSEGTIIAPLVAKNISVDALLLAGYSNDKLDEILRWQQSGGSSMIFFKRFFDLDNKGYITERDFDIDKFGVRKSILNNASFKELDANGDGKLDEQDFKIRCAGYLESLFKAINDRDDEWLKKNYDIRLTSLWFLEHFKLKPNRETLLELDLPIHIFHGIYDQNVPVEGVYNINQLFKKAGKTNLYVHIYENHDHDLNYATYPINGTISNGITDILNVCGQI